MFKDFFKTKYQVLVRIWNNQNSHALLEGGFIIKTTLRHWKNLLRLNIYVQTELYSPSPNSYAQVLTLSTSECDHIWRWDLKEVI